jgi:hypothetical protein
LDQGLDDDTENTEEEEESECEEEEEDEEEENWPTVAINRPAMTQSKMQVSRIMQEPLNLRTYHDKIRISKDGRFWPLLLQ